MLLLTQALMVAALAGDAKAIMVIGINELAARVMARVVPERLERFMGRS